MIFRALLSHALPLPARACRGTRLFSTGTRRKPPGVSSTAAASTWEREWAPASPRLRLVQEAYEAMDLMLRPAVRGLAMLRALGALREGDERLLDTLVAKNEFIFHLGASLPTALSIIHQAGSPRPALSVSCSAAASLWGCAPVGRTGLCLRPHGMERPTVCRAGCAVECAGTSAPTL